MFFKTIFLYYIWARPSKRPPSPWLVGFKYGVCDTIRGLG